MRSTPPELGRNDVTRGLYRDSLRRAVRAFWVGSLLGALLGIVGQIATARSDQGARWEPLYRHRFVGTYLLGAGFGFILFALTLVVLLLSRGLRERLCVAIISSLAAMGVVLHALGVDLRLATGSHLTLSGLEFFLNSGTHIASEMVHRFSMHFVGLAVIGVASAILLPRGVLWAFKTRDRALGRGELTLLAALVVPIVVFCVAPIPAAFAISVKETVPELAFADSLRVERARTRDLSLDATALQARALDAPPQTSALLWKSVAKDSGTRPNIILITVEAINIHHLGFMGYARDTTPNLDRIASQSLVAERAYTTATHSNYAQMAILSSLFPRRGSTLDMYWHLDYPRVLLHDVADELGYSTATISSQDESWQGMKKFEDTGTATYFFHSPDETQHLDIGTEEVVPDELTIDHVLSFIDRERPKNKPLSIYVNLQSTHFPYLIPESAARPFRPYDPQGVFNYVTYDEADKERVENRYDNALHYVDTQVGRLEAGLADRGMRDDTIIVFVADHGEMFREHDLVTHGRSLFESETRVPMLFHWPLGLEPGVVEAPVSTLDVLPTILDLIGAPPHPAMQGESILGERRVDGKPFKTADPTRSAVFMNIQGWKHLEAVVCYPYKAIYDPEADTSLLFDLSGDPEEMHDLTTQLPDVSRRLLDLLDAQIRAQVEFHEGTTHLARTHFAPRLLKCPVLSAPPPNGAPSN